MEPTESAAPDSRLRRMTGAWQASRRSTRSAPRPGEETRALGPYSASAAGRSPVQPTEHTPGLPGSGSERHLSWPALPTGVVAAAGFVLGAGFYRAFTEGHALFPSGTVGWSLALLSGIIVGHLVALGRARWWGGTGSGAALTLAVLLLYGWVPAGMVSLTVVVLVGIARRNRWRQGVLHGAVDILGIGAGALVLAAFGRVPSVETPWNPDTWTFYTAPGVVLVAAAYLAVTRTLLWYLHAPRTGGLPTVARTALVRQGLVAVALLGIAPLVCVVAVAKPVLLPLFSIPLIALDSTLWIARARAEEQLRDPLTGLPNRQWLLERIWTALDGAERIGARAALMLIDLDRFRSVNDTLGHLAGDRLLLQIADRLQAALPRGAEAARLGGDEFAVLLPVADSTTSATRVARNLVAALSSPSTSTGSPSSWRPAPESPSSPTTPWTPRGCCAGRTWRCTRRSGTVPASRSTSPSGTPTPPTGSDCWAICAGPWTRTRSSCTTSPRSASTDRWRAWRPSSGGCTRSAGRCRRTSSSPSPSRRG